MFAYLNTSRIFEVLKHIKSVNTGLFYSIHLYALCACGYISFTDLCVLANPHNQRVFCIRNFVKYIKC